MLSTIKVCEFCGKEFEVTYRTNQRFCGNRCAHRKFTDEDRKKVCKTCGKVFYSVYPPRSAGYCSKKCAGKEYRPVIQYDENMNVIAEYSSCGEAARFIFGDRDYLSRKCKENGKAYGYIWRYKDEAITQ